MTQQTRRSILVTGAGSGIGRATALLFAGRGWFPALLDIDADALARTVETIGADRCIQARVDTTDLTAYCAAVEQVGHATGGRLDVLFNCAGLLRTGWLEEMDSAVEARMLAVNVLGTVNGIRAALPLLRHTPGARIINMASSAMFYGVPELAMYSASKAAVGALTEALDLELGRHGITVCDLAPPIVDTPMVSGQPYQAGVYRTVRDRMSAETVAEMVWKAAHGNKVHWVLAPSMGVLSAMLKLFPRLGRSLMKRMARVPDRP